MAIYPVVISVPKYVNFLNIKYRKFLIKYFAKKSVKISFKKLGYNFSNFVNNSDGIPIVYKGFYWSLSHKEKYVCGVVDSFPIGIDIEEILPRSKKLLNRVASIYEWSLCDGRRSNHFLRYWTAKEAVLKAESIGLLGLSVCLIDRIIDESRMIVRYKIRTWCVEHFYFDNHIIAVAARNFKVTWFVCEQTENYLIF